MPNTSRSITPELLQRLKPGDIVHFRLKVVSEYDTNDSDFVAKSVDDKDESYTILLPLKDVVAIEDEPIKVGDTVCQTSLAAMANPVSYTVLGINEDCFWLRRTDAGGYVSWCTSTNGTLTKI